jgi:multicomponent Na+:H+ antiporter subunit F
MTLAISILLAVGGVMLTVAALLTVTRMARGPGPLDRIVAADVLVAVLVAGIALEAVWSHRPTSLLVLLVLSLLGFTGSVSVARLLAREKR